MMQIVDLGCGNNKYENAVGIDIRHCKNDVLASVLQAPLKRSIADLVVSRQVIEHLDAGSLVKEAYRILKPDGKIILETRNALYIFHFLRALRQKELSPSPEHIQIYTAAELRNLLNWNGFEDVAVEYFTDYGQVRHSKNSMMFLKRLIALVTSKILPHMKMDIRISAKKPARPLHEVVVNGKTRYVDDETFIILANSLVLLKQA